MAGTAESALLGAENAGWHVNEPFNEEIQTHLPWGLVQASGEDRTLRQHFRGANAIPSLAWRVAELTLTNLPAAVPTTRWFNYYGKPGTIPFYSFHRVIESNATFAIPQASFSNKVVFIGANIGVGFTGGTGTDHFRTPYSRWDEKRYSGTEVNATAYLNLARGDWLRRLHPLAEFLFVLGLGSLFGLGLPLCRPMMGTAFAVLGATLVAVVAITMVWQAHVWFAWAIGSLLQIPVALGASLLAQTKRLHREKELLAEQIVEAKAELATAVIAATSSTVISVPIVGAKSPAASNGPPAIPDHTLLRCIGEGAYGEVWLARNVIGTFHAVKVVYRKSFQGDEPFEREFRGIQKFMPISRSHPGLVHILHVGRNDDAGHIYCIMEAGDDEVTGQRIVPETYAPKNLAKEIKKRGRIPAAECLDLSLALTAALHHLHSQGLIHRDIKPSNIIFVKGQPKFADIGLVTELALRNGDASYLGTEGYIAPEGPGSASADVYSLGKVLYQASMGLGCEQFPELPQSLLQRPDSEELFRLNEIILKACHVDHRQRYQSAEQMHIDLGQLQKAFFGREKLRS